MQCISPVTMLVGTQQAANSEVLSSMKILISRKSLLALITGHHYVLVID